MSDTGAIAQISRARQFLAEAKECMDRGDALFGPRPAQPRGAGRPSSASVLPEDRVYFIRADLSGLVKIGHSISPRERLQTLSLMSPEPLRLIGVIPGGATKETELHRRFQAHRRHGEWFFASPELLDFIHQEASSWK